MDTRLVRRYSLPESAITPEKFFWNRRQFITRLALAATGTALAGCGSKENVSDATDVPLPVRGSDVLYPPARNAKYQVEDRTLTPANIAGRYNNFYEFTTEKAAVARLASGLTIDPNPEFPAKLRVAMVIFLRFPIGATN
jgi:sulfoxide reductase catalytic subunit YedY